ncbi:MAG: hypothetical protein IPL43_12085 [Micropruina sp.]|nr:hypothetical protein [Micropruina sp.]
MRCEAAMLLRALMPVADRHSWLPSALERLAAELATSITDEWAVRLCLNPGIALDLALVPLHLRAVGLGDRHLEPILADLLGGDRLPGPERTPNRQLEQHQLRSLWTGEVDEAGVARALAASSLAWEFDHLAGTTEDAYAFTHAILYATDHGRRRVSLPRPSAQIVRDADAILAVALDAGNHDVAAEVLWTWPMLNLPWTPLAGQAWAFLAHERKDWGFLPGPGFDPAVHHGLPCPERDGYVLRTSYHTTLVHGLLMAVIERRGGAVRPELVEGDAAVPAWGVAEAVSAVVQPSTTGASWWTRFASLPPATRDSLASALVTIALRRAVNRADLAAVRDALSLAADFRLPETPVIRQARVLLRRAMAIAGLAH